jgi:hypothetical protein
MFYWSQTIYCKLFHANLCPGQTPPMLGSQIRGLGAVWGEDGAGRWISAVGGIPKSMLKFEGFLTTGHRRGQRGRGGGGGYRRWVVVRHGGEAATYCLSRGWQVCGARWGGLCNNPKFSLSACTVSHLVNYWKSKVMKLGLVWIQIQTLSLLFSNQVNRGIYGNIKSCHTTMPI